MPKKMGLNSKAEEARERKNLAETDRKQRESRAKEDQYWREAEGEKSKAAKKKEEEAEKRAEDAEKRVKEAGEKAVEEYKKRFKIRKVEFTVHSQPTAVGRKRATIPSMFLVGVGNEAEEKLLANYRLFPDETEIAKYIAEKYPDEGIDKFAEMEKSIRDKYLLCVPHFGSYVRTCDMEAYEKEISALKTLGKKVGAHIREALRKKIDTALEGLYKILEQQWKKTGDPWYKEYLTKNQQALQIKN